MTINSLQLNTSTVVAGLGTQTFNVTTTGLYTVSFKSFLPYLAAGGQPATTNPSPEVSDVTLVADSGGSLNNKYFTFNSAGDLYGFYVWYNINGAGSDPAVAGRTGIEVAGATNATATTLATATRAAIVANATAAAVVTVSGATTHVILTNNSPGQCANTANAGGGSSPGFSYALTQGSYGVPPISGLNVVISNGATVLARYGFPSPTQPLIGGSVIAQFTAADVVTVVMSSLSDADAALNAVKTIVNLFQGE